MTVSPAAGTAIDDPTSLRGFTCVVTGGSMGIGFAIAEHIARAGGRLVICARGEAELHAAASKLEEIGGGRVLPVVADLSRAADVEHLFEAAVEAFGDVRGVVHCAAILGPIGPVVAVEPEQWLETLRVNLFGTFLVTRAACRRLIARGVGGSIVLLSGGGAGSAFPNYTAYACSKVGVARFTETVALEMAPHGIQVNCLGPGFVATRMHDETLAAGDLAGAQYLERTKVELSKGGVSPSVAARAAVFLLSSRSKGISGRFVAAPYDDVERWPDHLQEMRDSDLFTLRRIVPRDRGMDWQ
jgi:NAD(P)-dependent dehydrogenase (short-subunit alcohol dehydrogenase family)